MRFKDEHIWIVGASSGIGYALAEALAAQGATLILSSRRKDELEELNAQLGGSHYVYPLDVGDREAVVGTVRKLKSSLPRIDRIIFMAAIYRPADIDKLDIEFAEKMVQVNIMGVIYATYALLPWLKEQGDAQLVLCGSVAGFTGLPGGQPYSATKAAIINFAESLFAEEGDAIDIKIINPGFVRTRITDKNDFHMPMRIEPEQAAAAIVKGLKKKAFEIHFPKGFTLICKLLKLFPYPLTLWLTRKMRGKA